VHAGLIYVLIIPTNCSSVPLVAFFSGTTTCARVSNV
jgi:hypothetical protein